MGAILEELKDGDVLIRVGDGCNKHYDSFEWSVVARICGEYAELKGVYKNPSIKNIEDLLELFVKIGVKYVDWERVRGDGSLHRTKRFSVERLAYSICSDKVKNEILWQSRRKLAE